KRARDVDVEDPLPLGGSNILERPADLSEDAAGIVDEDVDATVRARRVVHERAGGGLVAHVHDLDGAAATSRHAEATGFGQFVLDDVAPPDRGAALSKC